MNILVIGNGGREHAICKKLHEDTKVSQIYCIPGNGGIAEIAACINIDVLDFDRIIQFAKEHNIDYTIVGPELPLSLGIVDEFQKHNLKIFGPTQKASQMETSKVFSKNFMKENNIPTADYNVFDNIMDAKDYIMRAGKPLIIKADGLSSGKGVFMCADKIEATMAVQTIMEDKKFGDSGNKIIIEEKLDGFELSLLLFVNNEGHEPMLFAKDHKRIFDGDKGPNCYSEDTEALTENGWKTFDKIEKEENVAVYEKNLKSIKFEKPNEIYWMKYNGKMILFKNRLIDILVTPNHNMLRQNRINGKESTVMAKDFKGEHYIYQSSDWVGEDKDFFILPEYKNNNNRIFNPISIDYTNWIKFMALYLSEGYTIYKKNEKRIQICQMKYSIYFNEFENILSSLPFNYRYEKSNNSFVINSAQLANYLKEFGLSHDKYIPKYIKNSTKNTIYEFLKYFNMGDGDIHYKKMRFHSSSKKLIDDIQELLFKINKASTITTDKRKTMISPINKKQYNISYPVFSVEEKLNNKTSIRKNNIKYVDYDGYVGCVNVSTGFIVVRRNNRISISGNTGGMGAVAPVHIGYTLNQKILNNIVIPTLQGMEKEQLNYHGILFIGLMIQNNEPFVLEYNCRFGDPEIQAILPLMKNNLIDIVEATINNKLSEIKLEWKNKYSTCVVLSSKGYPEKYETGKEITGLENIKDSYVFHSGTILKDNKYYTNGGRVLSVTSFGKDREESIKNVYNEIQKINFEGMYYRKDIGKCVN